MGRDSWIRSGGRINEVFAAATEAAQEFDTGLYAVDLTNPAAPRVTGMAPDFGPGALSVVGNRLHFWREDMVKVFQLE